MTSVNQAMPEPGRKADPATDPGHGSDIAGDAAGALRGGEDRRGDEEAAPRPLGRKDPALTGDTDPAAENVPIR